MKTFQEAVDRRHGSDENAWIVENLGIVARAVNRQPLQTDELRLKIARVDARQSGESHGLLGRRCFISRSVEQLTLPFGVAPALLARFAAAGTVVDVGSGQSDFLRAFSTSAETLAVDLNEKHVEYQRQRGHIAVQGTADALDFVETDSVRLLHASYSAPFWSPTPALAESAAEEFVRVLEPGGVALVGPFGVRDERLAYESFVARQESGADTAAPWGANDPFQAKVRMAFVHRVLESSGVNVVGYRHATETPDILASRPDLHVANHLAIQKL